jgi:hypothetical protein
VIGSASNGPNTASDATRIYMFCCFDVIVMVFLSGIACDF